MSCPWGRRPQMLPPDSWKCLVFFFPVVSNGCRFFFGGVVCASTTPTPSEKTRASRQNLIKYFFILLDLSLFLIQRKDHAGQCSNPAILTLTTQFIDKYVGSGRAPVNERLCLTGPPGPLISGLHILTVDRRSDLVVKDRKSGLEIHLLKLGQDTADGFELSG